MIAQGLWAGAAAGWICFVSGHWLTFLRLPPVDLAAAGRRYLDTPTGGWVFGLLHHLVNSALLGMGYVALIGRTGLLDTDPVLRGALLGSAFGIVVWAGLAMSIVLPATGRGWFGTRGAGSGAVIGNLVVHIVYGLALGVMAA